MSAADRGSDFDHRSFVRNLPGSPGVYQMFDARDKLLYVGKARNLHKRVASYFRGSGLTLRLQSLVRQIARIEVTLTHTETEALLLESNLIKQYRPRFNILLRDDKSYPYIRLSSGQAFPGLAFHRGSRRDGARYFGPYPSAGAVRETLALLQKVIPVRQCEDSYYRNRSRPCLQYQIKRCTAPCVGHIGTEEYARDVEQAVLFLNGRNDTLINNLVADMQQAADALDYEQAALLRDRIARVRQVQERQYVSGDKADFDVIAMASEGSSLAVGVMFIRSGRSLGTKVLFPRIRLEHDEAEVLAAFISQFYLDKPPAGVILVPGKLPDAELLSLALSERAGYRVRVQGVQRGDRRRWIDNVRINAGDALRRRLASELGYRERLRKLAEALGLSQLPERLECIDISHTQGEATVASVVVFGNAGPLNGEYRRYNIRDITPGDDYAAIRQALTRRYRRLRDEQGTLPDVLLIDGGKGQLQVAVEVLGELGIHGIALFGVAKGRERRAGWEKLFAPGQSRPLGLAADSPALHLVQRIRDEAHRFAITGHRARRAKQRVTSTLEEIPGIGHKKRQALLKHLGGLQGVKRAGVDELAKVPGISRTLAARIHASLHG